MIPAVAAPFPTISPSPIFWPSPTGRVDILPGAAHDRRMVTLLILESGAVLLVWPDGRAIRVEKCGAVSGISPTKTAIDKQLGERVPGRALSPIG